VCPCAPTPSSSPSPGGVLQMGDGSNFVVTMAGELLGQAEGLLRLGVHASDIIDGEAASGAPHRPDAGVMCNRPLPMVQGTRRLRSAR